MNAAVLVTGAGGYIGGSVVADLLRNHGSVIQKENIIAPVRSKEQYDAVTSIGVKAIVIDLCCEEMVTDAVLQNNVSIVIQTATSMDFGIIRPLVKALGKQKQRTGHNTYMIHTSGLTAFFPMGGWPPGPFKDTWAVFETERGLRDSFPIRQTDVSFIEEAKAQGVMAYVVVPPLVYGRGTGPHNQLSINLPVLIDAAIQDRAIYKFHEDTRFQGVHISDLTSLYGLLITAIISGKQIPHGERGYYFAIAHQMHWHEVIHSLAKAMRDRGLLGAKEKVRTWPGVEFAASTLGWPEAFVPFMFTAGADVVAERAFEVGWSPQWNQRRFLENIGSEVEDVLELGKAKSGLAESMRKAAGGA